MEPPQPGARPATATTIDRIKEPVALGDAGLDSRLLTRDAVDRAMTALRRIKTLSDRREVAEVMAFATSAIREARNGSELVDHVRATLGIEVEPISGEREAALIYRGVRRVVDLSDPALLVDIGGGSTELVVGDRRRAERCASLPLGAARLTERYVTGDPIDADALSRLGAHLDDKLAPFIDRCREREINDLVGSSGTIEAIARVAFDRSSRVGRVEQHVFSADEIIAVTGDLIASDRRERRDLGIDGRRVDQIAAGALLLQTILESAPITRVRVSPAALREGMVEEYLDDNADKIRQIGGDSDVLLRRARELALHHDRDLAHGRRVAAMACELFDQLEPVHRLGDDSRRLLEAAALLHDIGHTISGRRHHKHTRYIIEQSAWPGVEPRDVAVVACAARYHRRALPGPKHRGFGALAKPDRKRVKKLGALLRLADKLDRSHIGNTENLRAGVSGDVVHVTIATRQDPELELIAGRRAVAAFDDAFTHHLEVHAAWRPTIAADSRSVG